MLLFQEYETSSAIIIPINLRNPCLPAGRFLFRQRRTRLDKILGGGNLCNQVLSFYDKFGKELF
jgi:hypothetical protein